MRRSAIYLISGYAQRQSAGSARRCGWQGKKRVHRESRNEAPKFFGTSHYIKRNLEFQEKQGKSEEKFRRTYFHYPSMDTLFPMQESNQKEKWFQVSLRLYGDNLPVDEVESRLDIKPSLTGRMGEHIKSNPQYAKYSTNVWVWSFTKDSSVPFNEQIGNLLTVLESKRDALMEILALPGVQGELFLSFSSSSGQGSAYFPPSLLSRVAELRLALNLDLYPPEQ